MHNQTASTVSLAKTIRLGLDRTKPETKIATATLELLIATIIDLGERDNPTARRVETARASFVAARVTGVEGR